jgi:1-acyl-sn-glycerol-3-phosphate acyltransferase
LASWLLDRLGWQLRYEGFPARQGVAVIYPHTSNWDFPLMVLVKWAIGIPVRFWGKDSLFRIPLFGSWLRGMGGIPLDRSTPKGAVGEMLALFEASKRGDTLLWLALSPEGTRSRTPGWRSGFYRVAVQARVPLALIALDYSRRCIDVTHFLQLSGDEGIDFSHMNEVLAGVRGRRPELACPVQLLAEMSPLNEPTP